MASKQILKSAEFRVAFVEPLRRATVIGFVKSDDGVRNWCWLSNALAKGIRPGMVLKCEVVVLEEVCTTYVQHGEEKGLKVPRRQVRLGGHISVDAPEGFVSVSQVEFSEAARLFAGSETLKGIDVEEEPF